MLKSKPETFQCDSYLRLQIEILKFGGFWPLFPTPTNATGITRRLYDFFGNLHIYVLFLNLIHMAISQVISISIKWNGSIMDISPYLLETIVALTVMGFQLVFYLNHGVFRQLFILIDTQMRPRSIRGITFTDMQRPFKLAKYFTLFWVALSSSATAHYSLNPILDRERRLPIPVVYSFDVMESPFFEIEYCLQSVAQLQYGFAFSIIIGMISSVSIMLCGQMDVLYCSVHNLLYSAMLKRGDSRSVATVIKLQRNWEWKNKDKVRFFYSQEWYDNLEGEVVFEGAEQNSVIDELPYREYDGEVMEILKDLVRHHQFIISTARTIEKSFRSIFVLELFEHTAYTCIITYAMTMHNQFDNLFVHMVFYFFMVNLDTFLMCYTPHLLAEQVGRDLRGLRMFYSYSFIVECRTGGCHLQVADLFVRSKGAAMPELYDAELQKGFAHDLWKNISSRIDDQFQGG